MRDPQDEDFSAGYALLILAERATAQGKLTTGGNPGVVDKTAASDWAKRLGSADK